MGNLAGLGICCGADSGRQVGEMLEDAYIVTCDQNCFQEESCCPFTTSVISSQPGAEPGKCRESWAFSFLVVHSFFILALEKEQSSGLLFSSSQPRQTSLMETGSLRKESLEGVGLFSLPFILLEEMKDGMRQVYHPLNNVDCLVCFGMNPFLWLFLS